MPMRGSAIATESKQDLFEREEVRRRPWLLIVLTPILAVLALWALTEWRNGAEREDRLRSELKQVYREAEALRFQADQAQQKGALLEQQVAVLASQRGAIAKRLAELESQLRVATGQRPAPAKPAPAKR